jgi:hypothetical protein
MKTRLLITNLSRSIHQGETKVASKQPGLERLILITKLSEEAISPTKLKYNPLIPT